jgi:cell division control protein 6
MFEHISDRTGLIRSEAPLTTDYSPPSPVNRAQELDRIVDAVGPVTQRRQPENLLVYGPAGTGKTLLVDHVFSKMEDETRVTTVSINCWQYNTRSSLLTELLIQLGYPAPRKGKPVDALLAKLQQWIDKHRGVLVALDEFDQLTDQAAVAYDFQEVNDTADNPIGVLMVSNQPPTALELNARSRSRLAYHALELSPYSKQDLIEILHQRVDAAFHDDVVTNEAVERIAAAVATQNSDCRDALTLLRRAARQAEQDGADAVSLTHITQSIDHARS